MKKITVWILFLTTVLYAKETCYTIEIISSVNNTKNRDALEKNNYSESCKIMEISDMLTVRCGCYEKYSDAKTQLQDLKEKYKDAYIRTTYKSRFDTKKNPKKVQKQIAIEEVVLPLEKPILVPIQNSSSIVVQKPVQMKPKKNKSKKQKKKKVKLVKKKEAHYRYQDYLSNLSNERPVRPFGYLYSFGGQISYDLGYVDQKPAKFSDFPQPYFNNMWRRIRVDHKGSFFDKKLFYELEYSFTGNDHYKDIYIGYQDKMFSDVFYRVKVGNIKIPYSLQRYTTSKNLSFMERPLGDDAFSIPRKLGLEIFLHTQLQRHLFGLFLASYANSIDERKRDEVQKPGYAFRGTYTYKFAKRNLLHVGIGMFSEDYKGQTLRYKQNSESNILEEKYVSTKIKLVNKRTVRNLDALYLNNKYYLEAGFMDTVVDAMKDNYSFYSYFFEGSYFLIGRGKRFNAEESKFSKVKTTNGGALELGLRYSYINLNDKDEHGGEQTNYSLSLNWYITTEFKVMMNYIYALPKETDDYDGVINIYQMRFLFAF